MAAGGITTMEVRKINRHNIYNFIYNQKTTSKQGIVDALHLSLSTVTQSLKVLESEGLIMRTGYYESTGGRKAQRIEITRKARVTIGIGVLKDAVHLVAVDLYGKVIKNCSQALAFSVEDAYYRELGRMVSAFIENESWSEEQLLGAGVAIQGVISADGTAVGYGPILSNTGLTLTDLGRYLPCRSRLFHDSKAAAWAELWGQKDLKDAIVILLNENMGGALILNRQIHCGQEMRGGLIEHMILSPDGPVCYCGCRGCLETFLSADSLKKRVGCDLESFFLKVRENDVESLEVWEEYLRNLAFAIRNLQVVADADVVLSGLMNGFMIPKDFDYILNRIRQLSPFTVRNTFLIAGQHGRLGPAIGSALFLVKDWLERNQL